MAARKRSKTKYTMTEVKSCLNVGSFGICRNELEAPARMRAPMISRQTDFLRVPVVAPAFGVVLFCISGMGGFAGRCCRYVSSKARPTAFMELGSLPFCGGVGGSTTGLSVVNLRAESGSLDSSHSPQNRHLIASRRTCSLQKGHSLNALSSIASILPGP